MKHDLEVCGAPRTKAQREALLTACQDALAWIVQHKMICADLEGCVSLVVTLQGAIALCERSNP
jgi:hypothetical protein